MTGGDLVAITPIGLRVQVETLLGGEILDLEVPVTRGSRAAEIVERLSRKNLYYNSSGVDTGAAFGDPIGNPKNADPDHAFFEDFVLTGRVVLTIYNDGGVEASREPASKPTAK